MRAAILVLALVSMTSGHQLDDEISELKTLIGLYE
jgi:hypothetical protein